MTTIDPPRFPDHATEALRAQAAGRTLRGPVPTRDAFIQRYVTFDEAALRAAHQAAIQERKREIIAQLTAEQGTIADDLAGTGMTFGDVKAAATGQPDLIDRLRREHQARVAAHIEKWQARQDAERARLAERERAYLDAQRARTRVGGPGAPAPAFWHWSDRLDAWVLHAADLRVMGMVRRQVSAIGLRWVPYDRSGAWMPVPGQRRGYPLVCFGWRDVEQANGYGAMPRFHGDNLPEWAGA